VSTPSPHVVSDAELRAEATGPATFPAASDQPVVLSAYDRFSSSVASSALSTRLPTLDDESKAVSYAAVVVTTIEYESDLVAYKPEADLIVIADTTPLPLRIEVAGTVRMSQEALVVKELTGLAWEDRFDTPREADGGDFGAMTQALPDTFENRYFNGYRRDRRRGSSVPYPLPGDTVSVVRDGGGAYRFTLPAEVPVVEHGWYTGSGRDDHSLWKYRRVTMNLDTLVVEPDRDHAYAVWRAVWPTDVDPDGNGPIPLENNRRVTVLLEGA